MLGYLFPEIQGSDPHMLIYEYMKLQLEIKSDNKIILQLKSGGKDAGSLAWEENNDLSRRLLQKIDQILRKNRVGVDKISGYKIISDVPGNWTSVRIAEITFKSLALAKKNRL